MVRGDPRRRFKSLTDRMAPFCSGQLIDAVSPPNALTANAAVPGQAAETGGEKVLKRPLPIVPTEAELAAHTAFVSHIKEPVWLLP